MHPWSFKITSALVSSLNWFSVFVKDNNFLRLRFELKHVICKLCNSWSKCLVVAIWNIWVIHIFTCLPFFKLSSPKATEVYVALSVIINKNSRIYTEASLNVVWFWCELSSRCIACCNTNSENSILVASREIKIIFSVFISTVRSPHLL